MLLRDKFMLLPVLSVVGSDYVRGVMYLLKSVCLLKVLALHDESNNISQYLHLFGT